MAMILDAIHEPADIRKLTPDELSTLAMEIRTRILETVAKNGGHLASNLGAVELTLALHLAFDSPRDKIVWDVGHQCYAHKLLTGRKDRFGGLRRKGGILGFPCREESEHDSANTGHASTALSTALGMAVARDKAGLDHHVVAVVGDGSLTGGVALEALNQIGHLRKRLIIVLNDNGMSISPNVGAWSKYFSYLVSGHRYIVIKDQAKSLLKKVPQLGRPVIKAGHASRTLAKKMLFPGLVFTELGIRYIGPVHGHNIQSLVEAFGDGQDVRRPRPHPVRDPERQGLPAGEDASREIPRRRSVPGGDGRAPASRVGPVVLERLRRLDDQDRQEGREGPGHHRGHGRGDRPQGVLREVSPTVSSTSASPSSTP